MFLPLRKDEAGKNVIVFFLLVNFGIFVFSNMSFRLVVKKKNHK